MYVSVCVCVCFVQGLDTVAEESYRPSSVLLSRVNISTKNPDSEAVGHPLRGQGLKRLFSVTSAFLV